MQISGTSSLIFLSRIRFRLKQQDSVHAGDAFEEATRPQRLTFCCHRRDYAPPGGQWTLGLSRRLPGTLLRYSSGPPTGSNMRPSVPPPLPTPHLAKRCTARRGSETSRYAAGLTQTHCCSDEIRLLWMQKITWNFYSSPRAARLKCSEMRQKKKKISVTVLKCRKTVMANRDL